MSDAGEDRDRDTRVDARPETEVRLQAAWSDRALVLEALQSRLRHLILSGELHPGAMLTPERLALPPGVEPELASEALEWLCGDRLAERDADGALRVVDWRETAGLELFSDIVKVADLLQISDVIRAAVEARRAIGLDAVRLCAERMTPQLETRLREQLDGRAIGDCDHSLVDAYLELWTLIGEGADNLFYRVVLRSALRAADDSGEFIALLLRDEARDFSAQDELVEAIIERCPERAAAVADDLFAQGMESFVRSAVGGGPGGSPG